VTFQFQIEKLLKARKLNAGGWSKLERKENALVSLGKLALFIYATFLLHILITTEL